MKTERYGDYVVLACEDARQCIDEICESIRHLVKMTEQKKVAYGSTQFFVKTMWMPAKHEDCDENRIEDRVIVAIKFNEEVPENEQQSEEERD